MFKRATSSLTAFLLLASISLMAGDFSFSGRTDKDKPLYAPGEKMTFSVLLLEDGKPVDGYKLKWTRTGDDGKKESGEAISSKDPLVVSSSLDKPGFVRLQVFAYDKDGKPVMESKGSKPMEFSGGAGVEIEKLQALPEPADFDAFWAKQRELLDKVPVKVLEMKEVPSKNKGFKAYDVKIACAGAKPVSGYLTVPLDAKPKSCKAYLTFRGYSVCGADQDFRGGGITLQINAHGIENGREPEYYKALADGELKSYAFSKQENEKPETSYFNGMMLRVMRAMDYIKTLPEWNGKDLIVSGGSQGGLQCVTAAALDKDVTACSAGIPWCCDLGGVTMGRLRGWRPDWTEALGYYDIVNHAKRVKCPVTISAGLGDYVCPPSGVAILYNNIKSPKSLEFTQGKKHGDFGYKAPKDNQSFKLESK